MSVLPKVSITPGSGPCVVLIIKHLVGRLGILERENAAILNASLLGLGRSFIRSIQEALSYAGLSGTRLCVSCNDGTMISAQEALRMPVRVIASGPSNSMIGASYILNPPKHWQSESEAHSDQGDALIVIDIGGSTTDAGVLLTTGYPREASAYSEIAKLKVNFAMPDVQSIGLGGGSVVKWEFRNGQRHAISIGPESVGLKLMEKATCFGGDVLTATDIIIAAGDTPNFGNTSVVLEDSLIISAKEIISCKLEELVDEIKTTATPLPVAIVGGGSILLQSSLRGTSNILRNPLAPVANAVGAAVAKLSSTLDIIQHMDNGRSPSEDQKIIRSKVEEAIQNCVKRGALKESIRIITQDLLSLSYVSNKVRTVVQAVGDLDPNATASIDGIADTGSFEATSALLPNIAADVDILDRGASNTKLVRQMSALNVAINIDLYKPRIIRREWYLSEMDIEWISIGCYILGCAGGGTPYSVYLETRELIRTGETVKIIDITDIPAKAILLPVAKMGSPMVTSERPGGPLLDDALRITIESQKLESFSALVCIEVGGSNGIRPLTLGSSAVYNVPMLDGDFMGRAYPTFEKMTPYVLGSGNINDLMPISLASGDGTNLIMQSSKNTEMADRALRAACVEMGCAAGVVFRPMTKDEVAATAIMHTHSLAWRLGRAVKKFQLEQSKVSICDALIDILGGSGAARLIFEGKITAVDNRLIKGHSYGSITLVGTSYLSPRSSSTSPAKNSTEKPLPVSQEHLDIVFKNENLLATLSQSYESSETPQCIRTLASVPDLIMVLDSRSGHALGVPEYRYGLKAMVLVAAPHPFWTTARGLEVGGPKAFG